VGVRKGAYTAWVLFRDTNVATTKWVAYVIIIAALLPVISAKGEKETLASKEEPLWPEGLSNNPIVHKLPEKITYRDKNIHDVSYRVTYVSVPTIMFFPAPKESATGAAVVILPGGGYQYIAIEADGRTVARKLNSLGISAAVVKYRTMPLDPNGKVDVADNSWEKKWPSILADAKRAMRIVRSRAAELGADPNKIGVMGFSAGGHLAASLMLDAESVKDEPNDPMASVSCRPDFMALIYSAFGEKMFEKVRPGLGPCFIAIAANDPICPPGASDRFFGELQKAGVPSELHVFQSGGHGFNIGKTRGTESTWPGVLSVWLKQNGFHR
jgi:acetyl esterase/lipase